MASELQETSVNILSDDYCVNNSMFKLNELNFDVEFCAGMPDSNGNGLTDAGKDACQGTVFIVLLIICFQLLAAQRALNLPKFRQF